MTTPATRIATTVRGHRQPQPQPRLRRQRLHGLTLGRVVASHAAALAASVCMLVGDPYTTLAFADATAADAPSDRSPSLTYPPTPTVDHTDTYHGVEVHDPYRWLENDVRVDPEVADWVAAQNEVTFGYLRDLPQWNSIRAHIERLWDYERFGAPSKVADYYVFSKNDGLQNHSVYYIQDRFDAEPRVLLDPNTFSDDGTTSLAGMSFSPNGDYLAFSKSEAGSDWSDWFVMNVRTGEMLPDRITWTKWGGPSWTHDNRGFFYTRFPQVSDDEKFTAENTNAAVYYHRLGTPQADDVLVFSTPEHPRWSNWASVSDDGRWMFVYQSVGHKKGNRLLVRDLNEPYAQPRIIVDDFEHDWSVVAADGDHLYIQTDFKAKNDRVVRIDANQGLDSMVEILPEQDEPLRSVNHLGNMLVASYFRDVINRYSMYTLDGDHVRDVDAPGIGVVSGFGGRPEHTETFYTFQSPTTPPSIFRYDLLTGDSELVRTSDVNFNPDDYTTRQVFYTSKDGTRVPMFITHRNDIELTGDHPTILFGYGGFNIPILPRFSTSAMAWIDMGGVYASANIRGGGEYGERWHRAGTQLNKQNVFDDFIAAAEYLIDHGYTSPDHLAIRGGSNGGLLVGACMIQRPELFAAAVPAVGVMDMLRFHTFTVGRFWVDDYGSSDDPEQFHALYAYSPYHNLEDGVDYPATLVTTADTDDRVVPGHSFKFAARLQQAHAGDDPVLIRIQTSAGHGAGMPTSMRIDQLADIYSFIAEHTGLAGTD
jgi:prolyl oligopeptidase